ncbi:MAG TPA: hypothetical protein VK085_11980 [Pseudogracilibacillus sp.]|nr:hypothetical protein [Pseudogracilibacillus sp.]
MGLKSIELQVAIPRSQDAGKMQEQLMRQGQQFQETLTQQELKEEVLNRGKINEYEHVQHNNEKEDSKDQQQGDKRNKSDKKRKSERTINHPYLGNTIDFSR